MKVDEEKNLGDAVADRETEQGVTAWLEEIERACNAALMDIYDLSIANAPIPAKDCREIADCIGHRVGQVRESVAAIRAKESAKRPISNHGNDGQAS